MSESSFYGDDAEKARLEQCVAAYDPEPFWSQIHPNLLSTRQHEMEKPMKQECSDPDAMDIDLDIKPELDVQPIKPSFPSPKSLPSHKSGPNESIEDFLIRLPPSTTISTTEPWIWMYGQKAYEIESGDTATFVRKGVEILRAFEEKSAEFRAAHDQSQATTTAPLTRKLNVLRKKLQADILSLARETGVTAGKWMLFPNVRDVNEAWKKIVVALDQQEIDGVAKAATDDGSGQSRLICVYTYDFEDKEDLKRVVKMLVDKELVDVNDKPIYYKCDAYTYLEITSKNDYGLKASMFSSRDIISGKD
ncbi:hypothetical protein N7495_009776 [Penicillium taxi]|uniref:uncharacterized protein n=1 Tax=Penicillium taxi TaxID=168475 RepID=UPI00254536FA|nr:uncharacterized protein N7495_009776 [Penicillium taxi]KAJ5885266.1 hypothetical protein N7495_009776 [Penicillium taxi]